jgi:prephenate dehydrogenase
VAPVLSRVLVIGVGLMGTSVGLALRQQGVQVWLADRSARHVALAAGIGAGQAVPNPAMPDPAADAPLSDWGLEPQLVVVGVPPDAAGGTVAQARRRYPHAAVTDLASVKAPVIAAASAQADPHDLRRYVPGHPMAGSERSGPLAARRDLFLGRAWAIVTDAGGSAGASCLPADPAALGLVRTLVELCGATPVELAAAEHDAAVALVSHLPHLAAATVAGLLRDAPEPYLNLAGQGVRDVTRVAGGDPALWQQILASNAPALAGYVRVAGERLTELAADLEQGRPLVRQLRNGVDGVHRLPGKHGRRAEEFVTVDVVVPDRPGALASLFTDVTSAGVNIEDIRIDHNLASSQGLVQLSVLPAAEPDLADALSQHGWSVAG